MPFAAHVEANGGNTFPCSMLIKKSIRLRVQGATPLVVVENGSRVLGVIALKDIVKGRH